MSVSTKDFNQIQREANEILIKLSDVENLTWVKKKDLLKSYIEKSRMLLDNDKLPVVNKNEFASYMYETLKERNINVSQNENWYAFFNDDEKGNQNKKNCKK